MRTTVCYTEPKEVEVTEQPKYLERSQIMILGKQENERDQKSFACHDESSNSCPKFSTDLHKIKSRLQSTFENQAPAETPQTPTNCKNEGYVLAPTTITMSHRIAQHLIDDVIKEQTALEEKHVISKCLQNHQISSDVRSRMVDWMVEVFGKLSCNHQTLFLAVSIMDRYLAAKKTSLLQHEIHLLGIASMLIASKFEDVTPLSMETAFESLGHQAFSEQEIFNKEMDILITIRFEVHTVTPLEFLNQYIMMLFKSNPDVERLRKISTFLLKLCLYDSKMSEILTSTKAAAVLLSTLKMCEGKFNVTLVDSNLLQDISEFSGHSVEELSKESAAVDKHVEKMKSRAQLMKNLRILNSAVCEQFLY